MTYLDINAINSNPIFAPLGEEANFKRRIFLNNFSRCMTIRPFQKTAGILIKKAITGVHPVAQLLKKRIGYFNEQNDLNKYNSFRQETFYKYCKNYRYLHSFENRLMNNYHDNLWNEHTKKFNKAKCGRFTMICDKIGYLKVRTPTLLYKLGVFNFMDFFMPWINSPKSKKGAKMDDGEYEFIYDNNTYSIFNREDMERLLKIFISIKFN